MSLHISISLPSRDLERCAMDRAVTRLAERVALTKRRQSAPRDRVLDVSFLLSSEQDAPPFTGMRMGGYRPQDNILYFQAAVPARLSHSDQAADYVSLVLQDVVDNAADYFAEAGLSFAAAGWREWCEQLQRAGEPTPAGSVADDWLLG